MQGPTVSCIFGSQECVHSALPHCDHWLGCAKAVLLHLVAQTLSPRQTPPRILEIRVKTFGHNASHLEHIWVELPENSLGKETRIKATLHDNLSSTMTVTAIGLSILYQPQIKPPCGSCSERGCAWPTRSEAEQLLFLDESQLLHLNCLWWERHHDSSKEADLKVQKLSAK